MSLKQVMSALAVSSVLSLPALASDYLDTSTSFSDENKHTKTRVIRSYRLLLYMAKILKMVTRVTFGCDPPTHSRGCYLLAVQGVLPFGGQGGVTFWVLPFRICFCGWRVVYLSGG